MSFLSRFLTGFFYLLYHPFAWSYDLVAWSVSLGRWKDWIRSVIPFIEGPRVLELGHGPGHLLRSLRDLGGLTVGMDESRQMGLLAKRNLSGDIGSHPQLLRGIGQNLPLRAGSIDCVVATFPTEYIFEPQTLSEVWRVLNEGGRFIVLPVAWITGTSLLDKAAAWLFRITGQSPSYPDPETTSQILQPFLQANFHVRAEQVKVKSSMVFIIIAEKGAYVKQTA